MNKELEESITAIWEIGKKFGLDPFPTNFHLVPSHIMYEFGAYGLPGRFSHWTHGQAYHQMKTMYDYGLQKIYELVINTNPTEAFLLENNDLIHNKLVIAHVMAHSDFFKNNVSFLPTNRKMAETVSLNAERIKQYEFNHGMDEVEKFLDSALSLELNIDPHELQKPNLNAYLARGQREYQDRFRQAKLAKSEYDDLFNLGQKNSADDIKIRLPFPYHDEQDLLWVLYNSADLEDWQKDILEIVRYESQYFLPQRTTRMMNEGWATLGHLRILRELDDQGLLKNGEDTTWMKLHANIIASIQRRINPYYVGLKIWEDIDRKHQGLPHPDGKVEKDWLGKWIDPKGYMEDISHDIFWARENINSDQTFLRNYLTHDLIEELDLFIYALHDGAWKITEKDPQGVKSQLLKALDNFGQPVIKVVTAGTDYKGNRELYLKHFWTDVPLDILWAEKTLHHVRYIWGRDVHLETRIDDKSVLLSCGEDNKISRKTL